MKELREKYENGTFPLKALTVVASQADAEPKAEYYFVEDKSLFVFPTRELTDEELLEMIDFYYCRDYNLKEKVAQDNKVTESPDEFIEEGGMDEKSAEELAKTVIFNIYGIDFSDYNINYTYDNMSGNDPFYNISIKDKNSKELYVVDIDADQKIVKCITYFPKDSIYDTGI